MKFQSVSKAFADSKEQLTKPQEVAKQIPEEVTIPQEIVKQEEKRQGGGILDFCRSVSTDTYLVIVVLLLVYIYFLCQKLETLSSLNDTILKKLVDKL